MLMLRNWWQPCASATRVKSVILGQSCRSMLHSDAMHIPSKALALSSIFAEAFILILSMVTLRFISHLSEELQWKIALRESTFVDRNLLNHIDLSSLFVMALSRKPYVGPSNQESKSGRNQSTLCWKREDFFVGRTDVKISVTVLAINITLYTS